MTKDITKFGNQGIYRQDDLEAKPVFLENNLAIYQRPNLHTITFDLLVRKKKYYDVGVWSSADFLDTKLMVEKLFGRYFTQ